MLSQSHALGKFINNCTFNETVLVNFSHGLELGVWSRDVDYFATGSEGLRCKNYSLLDMDVLVEAGSCLNHTVGFDDYVVTDK